MDSICTRLSRLEATVTTASNAQLTEDETDKSHEGQGSSHTDTRNTAVVEGEKRSSQPLPDRGAASSVARDPGTGIHSQQEVPIRKLNGLDSKNQSRRTRGNAAEHNTDTDKPIDPREDQPKVDESDDQEPLGEVNKVSELYAEFSKKSEPRRNGSSAIEVDNAAIHNLLQQSLANLYPPEIVKYISLQQIITLCEDHIALLETRPKIQTSTTAGKMKDTSYVDDETPILAGPSMMSIRNRLVELRKAIQVSKEQCVQAGYSCSELDKLLSPPGTRSWAPARRPPQTPDINSGDDSSSVYSEDFHSSAE